MADRSHKPVFPLNQDEISRLRSGINECGPGECWEWQRSTNSMGYGQLMALGRNCLAHRVAWALANGRDIPPKHSICHSCDNPKCCNPAHLFLGDQKVNYWDARRKGRTSMPPKFQGITHPACKLTEDQVRAIRKETGTAVSVAAKLGVTLGQVKNIRSGKVWKHVA